MKNIKEVNITYILKTKKNANELISFLDVMLDNTHSVNDFDINKLLRREFQEKYIPRWSDYLISKISLCLTDMDGMQAIRNFVIDLKETLENAKEVKIEIPFMPSDSFINEVYDLLNDAPFFLSIDAGLKNNFLLDLLVNESIKGGIKVFVEGKFIDVTYRNFVANYLMSKDVIKRYL